eukprot:690772-Ditylum_brightwellii.AAC.1
MTLSCHFLLISAILFMTTTTTSAFLNPIVSPRRAMTTIGGGDVSSQFGCSPMTTNSKSQSFKTNTIISNKKRIRSTLNPTILNLSGGGGMELIATASQSLFSYAGNVPLWQAFALNAALFSALSPKLFKMLTPEGFAHSVALGQAVTKVRFEEKEKMGIAEGRGGRRGPENVWGSAATALICAACAAQGKAYGKTTFLITTFEKVEPGTEGAVSLEGTLAAMVGGLLLPLYGLGVDLITPGGVVVATIAAFLATNAESVIGATIQGKAGFTWMTNEVVNFVNTLIGASIAISSGIFILNMV